MTWTGFRLRRRARRSDRSWPTNTNAGHRKSVADWVWIAAILSAGAVTMLVQWLYHWRREMAMGLVLLAGCSYDNLVNIDLRRCDCPEQVITSQPAAENIAERAADDVVRKIYGGAK